MTAMVGVLLALVVLGALVVFIIGFASHAAWMGDTPGAAALGWCLAALVLLFAVAVYITPGLFT